MRKSSNYVCCHRNRHLSFYLMLLLVSSLTQVRFMAEGRSLSRILEVSQTGIEDEKAFVRRSMMIGSRPPKCERRCSSCPQCEAIQVPVAVAVTKQSQSRHFTAAEVSLSYSRGNGISNYKPMSWKCKCGNFIFNP